MIAALRWLKPLRKAQFCLRCGTEFEAPEHVLCARCREINRELSGRHG